VSTVDPLRTAALEQLERLRQEYARGEGRSPVAEMLRHCFANQIPTPDWLQGAFLGVCEQLRQAKAETWDDALGRYWPDGTRIEEVRRRLELEESIPAAVWELFSADTSRPINRDFFEEVGERAGVHLSGSTVERHYYRLVREGRAINLVALRATGAWPTNPHQTPTSRGLELQPVEVQSSETTETTREATP
jgi:hypothetical protein